MFKYHHVCVGVSAFVTASINVICQGLRHSVRPTKCNPLWRRGLAPPSSSGAGRDAIDGAGPQEKLAEYRPQLGSEVEHDDLAHLAVVLRRMDLELRR